MPMINTSCNSELTLCQIKQLHVAKLSLLPKLLTKAIVTSQKD